MTVTMSCLTAFAARVRDHRLCLRLLNSLRTSPGFELAAPRTPNCSLAPPCLRWSATSTTAQASPAENEESLPTSADSAAVSLVSGERVKEAVDIVPKTLKPRKWNRWSRRTGLVAIKLGMTQLWSKQGFPIAVTVLQVCTSLSLSFSLPLPPSISHQFN